MSEDSREKALSKEMPSWKKIQDDLRSALEGWSGPASQNVPMSPEEKKLAEVRALLEDLQAKIKKFEES